MDGEHRRIGAEILGTRVLEVADLATVIADVGLDSFMDEMITRLSSALASYDPALVEHQIRRGFSYDGPELGLVEWMPTMAVGDVVAVKTVGYHPMNPTRQNLPSVLATTCLYDTRTGALEAICEATLLTAMRTGATSAVVTSLVAKPGPIVLGVVGAGAQAVTQIHAISRVRSISRIVVCDVDESVAATLLDRLPDGIGVVEVVSKDDFDRLVPELDVLCTCTSVAVGEGPVVDLSDCKPWLHVNAVGADFPGKTELGLDDLRASTVICDIVEQCLIEGESQRLARHELGPDMVALVSTGVDVSLAGERTVFDSTGWSFEDLIAAQLFIGHAERLGLGRIVTLHHQPSDPYSPYEMLSDADSPAKGLRLAPPEPIDASEPELGDPTQAGFGLAVAGEHSPRLVEG